MAGLSGVDGAPPPLLSTTTGQATILHPAESRTVTFRFTSPGPVAFQVDDGGTTCHCAALVQRPAVVPPEPDAVNVDMRITAGDAPELARADLWLLGRLGTDNGYLLGTVSYEVRDYLVWPQPQALWDLGDVSRERLPFVKSWRLARGNHPQQWDTIRVRQDGENPPMDVSIQPVGDEFSLRMEVRDDVRFIGPLTSRLHLGFSDHGTECSYKPDRTLRINVVGDRAAVPASVLFGVMAPGVPVSRDVEVRPSVSGQLPALGQIAISDPAEVQARIAMQDGQHLQLTVTCSGSATQPVRNGHMDLTFVDGITVRIPYFGRTAMPKSGPKQLK